MKRSSVIPAEMIRTVDKCINAWLKTSGLTWGHVHTAGLSDRNTRRILKGENFKSVIDWVDELNVLYKRLHAIAAEHEKTPPTNWHHFFSRDFPIPTVRHEPALYNNAEIQSDELKTLVDPLINLLATEAKIAASQNNVWKASSLLNHVCDLDELVGNWSQAEIHLAHLAALNTRTGDFHFAADAYLRRGQALLHDGDAPAALQAFEEGIRVIKKNKDRTPPHRVNLRLLSYKAIAKLEMNDPVEARRILSEDALPLATNECSPPALASVHNRLALVALKIKDLSAAMGHVLVALETRLECDMRSEVARSLATLARVHWAKNEIEQAVFIGELSLHMQQALNDHETLAQTHYFLGTGYAGLHEKVIGRQKQKLTLSVNPDWFRDPREAHLLQQSCDKATFSPTDRRPSNYRNLAIQHFKTCAFLERNTDAKSFPDALTQAQKLVDARRVAGG